MKTLKALALLVVVALGVSAEWLAEKLCDFSDYLRTKAGPVFQSMEPEFAQVLGRAIVNAATLALIVLGLMLAGCANPNYRRVACPETARTYCPAQHADSARRGK